MHVSSFVLIFSARVITMFFVFVQWFQILAAGDQSVFHSDSDDLNTDHQSSLEQKRFSPYYWIELSSRYPIR